jgi:hypothetical protein
LAGREVHTHLGENLPGLIEADIARLFHSSFYPFSSAAIRYSS